MRHNPSLSQPREKSYFPLRQTKDNLHAKIDIIAHLLVPGLLKGAETLFKSSL